MTFTGSVRTVETAGATIAAVIPVGTSTLGPSVGYAWNRTQTQQFKREFKVAVESNSSTAACENSALKNVDSGEFIAKTLRAQYDETFELQSGIKPTLYNVSLELTIVFGVTRKPDGGVRLVGLFNNPSLTSLTPTVSLSHESAETYTLVLRFPLKKQDPVADTRRFLDCKHDFLSGRSVCVESPYVERDDKKRFDGFVLRGARSGTPDLGYELQSGPQGTEIPAPGIPEKATEDVFSPGI